MVFVDAENVSKKLFKRFYDKHPNEFYKVFGKTSSISSIYLSCKNVQFINCFTSKNSADTFMTAYIVDSIYNSNINIYYVISSDSDLCIAIKMLTDHNKNVIIVREQGNSMQHLNEIGANLSLISFEEYSTGMYTNGFKFIRVSRNKSNCFRFDACTNYAWFKGTTNTIVESPFRNGMPLNSLKALLTPYAKSLGIGSSYSWKNLVRDSFLQLCGNNVYWLTEEELNVL